MSILKRQVHSPLNFVYLFGFMKDNSSVLFSSSNIYFAQKEPIKVKIFETSECSGQNLSNSLCQFWNGKSIPLQILYLSSVSWKITHLYFFSSNNIYFAQKEPSKVKIFETFDCSGQNMSNSWCQFWNNKSIPLQILYPSLVSWKITPLYLFSSNNIYFAQKEPIKVKMFETFECSGQNLSNSFCQFWNDKSIPLQILCPYSIWWKITPLTFLPQTIYTLLKTSLLKWKFLRLSNAWVNIHQIPHVNFETTSQFLLKFCVILRCYDR